MSAASGLEHLKPFLPALESALEDSEVSEIMINGPGNVWVERAGRLAAHAAPDLDEAALLRAAIHIARPLGLDPDSSPIVDARLDDGSRVAICVPPASPQVLISDDARRAFERAALNLLWDRRDSTLNLNSWLNDLKGSLIDVLVEKSRTLDDEAAIFEAFLNRTMPDGDAADLTLGQFAGDGEGNDRINLSTLHSAKGREFALVVLFGMDDGRIPRNGAGPAQERESRRLFYVGFTRAERELHLVYSAGRPSPFVLEVQKRLEE